MNPRVKYALIGLIFILIVLIWICLFSYKGTDTIFITSLMFLFCGCNFFITYYLIGRMLSMPTILNAVWWLFFVGSFFLAQELANKRTSFVLANFPSKTVTATVITVQNIHSANVATLKFFTTDGYIQQQISNNSFGYKPGRLFLIKYSIRAPNIFQVIKQVK
jgi:hypothetical protein